VALVAQILAVADQVHRRNALYSLGRVPAEENLKIPAVGANRAQRQVFLESGRFRGERLCRFRVGSCKLRRWQTFINFE
jgi:hypothetical protein